MMSPKKKKGHKRIALAESAAPALLTLKGEYRESNLYAHNEGAFYASGP
jgi:hypothetical protein